MTSFWTGLGHGVAGRWVANILTPAFLFWAGGLAAWAIGGAGSHGLADVVNWIAARSAVEQVALAIGALWLVVVSGVVDQRLALVVIRLLEGYHWPRWLMAVRRALVRRQQVSFRRAQERWQGLADRQSSLSADERQEYGRLDDRLRRVPSDPDDVMPTQLGNVLRAAETWPWRKYGLDAVKCWPRLWLLLPPSTREEVSAARSSLDGAASVLLWGALFCVWTPWAWWAPLVSLAVCVGAYLWMRALAPVYADLVEAAFDVHRAALYSAVGWPVPTTPRDERPLGIAFTMYLWRGSGESWPRLAFPSSGDHGNAQVLDRPWRSHAGGSRKIR